MNSGAVNQTEPFANTGSLWPSPDYQHQVERLRAAIGRLVFIAELSQGTVQLGTRLTNAPHELLAVLDFPRPDPARGLAPHFVLLDDGRGINLGRIARISIETAFAPRPDQLVYQDAALHQGLLFRDRQLSPAFIAERAHRLLARALNKPVTPPPAEIAQRMAPTETPASAAQDDGGSTGTVLRFAQIPRGAMIDLLAAYGLELVEVAPGAAIPGSYWGAPEAGLVGDRVFVREDTPLHSLLHESCHVLCMDRTRRASLHTDAGGTHEEENAVCLLQILLGEQRLGLPRARLFADMDAWGYSFRLGSTQAWFEQDAEDARQWLRDAGLIDPADRVILGARVS